MLVFKWFHGGDIVGLKVGQLVSSKMGRDCQNKYLVLTLLDDGFVLIANGKQRKVLNPKRKNSKHLVAHLQVATHIAEAVVRGEKVTNQQLRASIEALSELSDQGREEGSSSNG